MFLVKRLIDWWKKLETKYKILFCFLIFLRLFLASVTAHSDVWALFIAQNLFVFKKVFNIYDYLAYLPKTDPVSSNYGTNFFTYPPLAYFVFGFFGIIFRPLLSFKWFNWFVENYPYVYSNLRIFIVLLIFKIPYLIFDLGVAFLLASFFKEKRKRNLAFFLWLLNPLSFYTSFMVGQFDIIPVFFTLLALRLFLLKKKNLSAICLGLGGGLKMFPLFFLPFLASLGKNFYEKLKIMIIGLGVYLIIIFPFLFSSAFRNVCLFSSQSQKMLFMGLPVSGAETIYIFVFLYIFLFWKSWFNEIDPGLLWEFWLVVLLLFFSATHFHPQWFLWITPFLIWELVENNFRHGLLVFTLFSCWLFITLMFEASLSYGLFVPLKPSLIRAQSLLVFVSRFTSVYQFKSLLRSIFAGTALFYSFTIFKNKNNV